MLRAIECQPQGARHGLIDDEVTLDFDNRHRRRLAMTGKGGLEFLLDLPRAQRLRQGDTLVLEDGRRIRIVAAKEPLAQISATSAAGLIRVAWHLGNRHLPVMLLPDRILIRRDHVIENMVRLLGASVEAIEAAFDPEDGAYAGASTHHHHHEDHDHG
jgi:urease accessory protein